LRGNLIAHDWGVSDVSVSEILSGLKVACQRLFGHAGCA